MKPTTLLFSMAIFGLLSSADAEPLAVGAKAPEVTGITQTGEKINLGDAYKKGLTLVYFYPKADTPGCTAQACSLRDSYAPLQDKGIQIFGVSHDSPESQTKFKAKYNLPFTLIADEEKTVIHAFGVPTTLGFASRQAFLIKDGVVVWRDLKASTAKQAEDVLKALSELK
jgi:peroxiredoxin Q/BCP